MQQLRCWCTPWSVATRSPPIPAGYIVNMIQVVESGTTGLDYGRNHSDCYFARCFRLCMQYLLAGVSQGHVYGRPLLTTYPDLLYQGTLSYALVMQTWFQSQGFMDDGDSQWGKRCRTREPSPGEALMNVQNKYTSQVVHVPETATSHEYSGTRCWWWM